MKDYRVPPESKVRLAEWNPSDLGGFEGGKSRAHDGLAKLTRELRSQQEILYAQHLHKVLIVLQGMDTSGKDGTIRHVFRGVNPQGVRVANFKTPTPQESDHDFLWRVHRKVPRKGEIVIFNRSHYEDVLIARVAGLVPRDVWRKRFDHINDFERMLADEGTTIIKIFLHIDARIQKKRLQARLDDPQKRWKFNPLDLQARERWDAYREAYEDVLAKTSTKWAPWNVVPANRKWYRNWVVSSIIVSRLGALNLKFPPALKELRGIRIE